jgi:Sel1 repeat
MATSDGTVETTGSSASEGRDSQPEFSALNLLFAPAATARARRYMPVPLDQLADSGEPVDDPPPLVEPEIIGFDEPPPRPTLFDTLRATRPHLFAAPAGPTEPVVVEPPEAPAASVVTRISDRVKPRLRPQLSSLAEWGRRAPALPGLGDWRRLISWGRWAAAAAIAGAIIYIAALGLLHQREYRSIAPLANAPSDPAQRLAYFQRGADAGDREAELQLAILYAKGEGVAQDYGTAAKWFRAAAEQGLPRAQYDLGVLYERGRGVPTDSAQAASWYRKAAEGKYPLAQYNLAVAYTKGEGTRKDLAEAAVWYRRAAVQGVVQAMVNLAMLYERGDGVPASPVDAYAWYQAAARRGNQPASKRADDLFGVLSQQDQVRAQKLASDVAGSIHDPTPGTQGG